jgi:UDP-N-acetylmuramoyl-tripeptide--D-alanyl-D-alanine ligase
MFQMTLEEVAQAVGGRVVRAAGAPGTPSLQGVSTDSRTTAPGNLFIALTGERFDGHEFVEAAFRRGASVAVVSRPPASAVGCGPLVVVGDTLRALGDLARAWRNQLGARVIGVTGTAGKTTTRDMIAHLLAERGRVLAARGSFNNFIGVPLTLLGAGPGDDFIVAELGTSAPGEIARLADIARPDAAVITAIGPGHLEGLVDMAGVAREKADILTGSRAAVLPAECPHFRMLAARAGARQTVIPFGFSRGAAVRGEILRENPLASTVFRVNGRCEIELPLPGRHNVLNALGALAVAWRMGVDVEAAGRRLSTFAPPPQRMAVRRFGPLTVIDDAYNANPLSFAASLEVLAGSGAGRKVCVAGDMLELGADSDAFHLALGGRIAQSGVERLLLAGERGVITAAGARGAGMAADRITMYASSADLARSIPRLVRADDVVLVKGSHAVGLSEVVNALEQAGRRMAERLAGIADSQKPRRKSA